MARPPKVGLEYFPLDCQMDDKVEILEAVHELTGFAIYIKLLQEIYPTEVGELDMSIVFRWKTLGKKYGIPEENLRNMVGTMLEIGLFDKTAFAERNVLTSNGIKKRLCEVSERRKKDRTRKSEGAGEFSSGKPSENATKGKGKEVSKDTSKKGKKLSHDDADASGDPNSDGNTNPLTLLKDLVTVKIPDYYWNGKDAKNGQELLQKMRHSVKSKSQKDPTDAEVVSAIGILIDKCKTLPFSRYKSVDVPILNSDFNKIMSEIQAAQVPKNGTHVDPQQRRATNEIQV